MFLFCTFKNSICEYSPLVVQYHLNIFPLSFYKLYEWVVEGSLHYECSTRSFLFQKSRENPVFHHMCPLSRVYLAVIDFYDSYGDSFIHFVCRLVQAQKRRAGEAHVGPAGEQERAHGPAGRSHEAAEGTKLVGQQFGFSFPTACMKPSFVFSLYAHFFSFTFLSPTAVSLTCLLLLTVISHLLADRMKSRNRQ